MPDLRNWGRGRPDTPAATAKPQHPTREEFDAAAKRVMESAPEGLSREEFYTLIDKELAGGDGLMDMMQVRPPTTEGGQPTTHEPDTFWGGFGKSIKDQVLQATIGNPMLQDAAHPSTLGDIISLVLPSGAPNMRAAAGNVGREIKAGASEAPKLRNVPGSVLNRISQYWKETPEGTRTRRFNDMPLAQQMEHQQSIGFPAAGPEGRATGAPFEPELIRGETLPPKVPKAVKPPKPERMSVGGQTIKPDDPLYNKLMEMAGEDATSASSSLRSGSNVPGAMTPTERLPPEPSGPTMHVQEDIIPEPTGDPTMVAVGEEGRYNAAQPTEPQPSEDAFMDTLLEKLGGRGPEAPASKPMGEPRIISLKPEMMGPEDWAEARRYYGSRRLAELTGKTEEEVIKLAPGPHRWPLEREGDIMGDSRTLSHLPKEE